MMAARTGKTDAMRVLVEAGANVNAKETWGGTTPADVGGVGGARRRGAGADRRRRGREGTVPLRGPRQRPRLRGAHTARGRAEAKPAEFASGWLTPLMVAAREGNVEVARLLVSAGADVNAVAGDGKTALAMAIFNGNYDFASLLVDSRADVNKADAQRFTPLFWAVDRRNMETAPNFPWMVTADPLPLIRKLLDAGANPNALVNNTPRARMREGSPRIVFATALMRAAFAADLELVQLLLDRGADPKVISRDGETMVSAAAGLAFIHGYHRGKSPRSGCRW